MVHYHYVIQKMTALQQEPYASGCIDIFDATHVSSSSRTGNVRLKRCLRIDEAVICRLVLVLGIYSACNFKFSITMTSLVTVISVIVY